MPNPRKGQSKEEFIAEYMHSEESKKTFPDTKQRLAVAESKWEQHQKKQHKEMSLSAKPSISVKEADNKTVYTFYAATTVPDRVADEGVDGEILTKQYLEKASKLINDTSTMGGKFGAYRTVGLFHDRIYYGDQTMEEAGYLLPNSRVVPMKEHPGHYALEVDVEVNDMYVPSDKHPDYTPEKIKYKIDKGAVGLSIEYTPSEKEYHIAHIDNGTYRVVDDFAELGGFSFARANVIGNPTAVAIKESISYIEENKMAEQELKLKEQVDKLQAEVKEFEAVKAKLKEAEQKGADGEVAVKELQTKLKEMEASAIPAAQVKEILAKSFESIAIPNKVAHNEGNAMKTSVKEIQRAIDANDWNLHAATTEVFLKENEDALMKSLRDGIKIEDFQTLQVKCVGSGFKVVPTVKTKDVLTSSDMAEGTYYQTNAMFADRYVAQITETFLMDDTLLKAMPKEQHVAGNDQYQWRIWTEFFSGSTETAAVNPETLSVTRNVKDFEKMQTPIKEYRWGVEVSDFTQYHSRQSVGDLIGIQVDRAAKIVTQSMAADIFKENADGDSYQFLGLEAVADTTGNTTLYGKTRSTANRLTTGTLADTYVTTSEGITTTVIRAGYEKVLSRGSSLGNIAIVTHPTQVRRLFDTQDNTAATYNSIIQSPVTMAGAPASFGFNRAMIPYVDGIPVIRDYNCQNDAFYVIDMSLERGFVLVVSKPLGMRGLAKVGTSESAYVNFYGAAVYKSPINIFLHDSLTTS